MFHYMSWLEIWLVYHHAWLMAPWMYQQKWLVRHFRFPETKTEE